MLDLDKKIAASDNNVSSQFLNRLSNQSGVSPEFVVEISVTCETMLNSGWYGDTTCQHYITLCEQLMAHKSLWSVIGSQCQTFSANNRITLEYLRTLQDISSLFSTADQIASSISIMNSLLSRINTESPPLIISAIRTAKIILVEDGGSARWVKAVQRFSLESGDHFQTFLNLSHSYYCLSEAISSATRSVNHWQWLESICDVNVNVSLAFMAASTRFGVELLEDPLFEKFVTTIAMAEERAIQLIELVGENWDAHSLQNVLPFAIQLGEVDGESLRQLLILSKEKSLDLSALDSWLNEGLLAAQENGLVGEAWFSLESLKSKISFKNCRGSVHLEDCSQLLNLVSEGLGGRVFSVAPIEDGAWVLDNFAEYMHLPVEVALSNDYEENLSFYRLMILYQVSFWESGIADFLMKTDKNGIANFVASAHNRQLALNLINILIPVFVERFMIERYPGIKNDLTRWQNFYGQKRLPEIKETDLELLRNASMLSKTGAIDDLPADILMGSRTHLSSGLEAAGRPLRHRDFERLFSQILVSDKSAVAAKPEHEDFQHLMLALNAAYADYEYSHSVEVVEAIFYRGTLTVELALLSLRMDLVKEEVEKVKSDDDSSGLSDLLDPENISVEELRHGSLDDAMGQFLTDVEAKLMEEDIEDEGLKQKAQELREKFLIEHGTPNRQAKIFTYDEWDYQIRDYRKDWCILHEQVLESKSEQFIKDTLNEHSDLLRQIRKQLQMLKPELHRKVRGLTDGEDIHHDDAIDAMVDLRSGISPNENIYIQRLKAERDVSTLFLLDMSASTDESLELFKAQRSAAAESDPSIESNSVSSASAVAANKAKDEAPEADHIDYLMDAFDANLKPAESKDSYRIIDIERQSVVLMAEALEELGDSYAIAGFSGYGREQVDYFQCKDFDERYDRVVKGRIEAISPRQSTRMGPSIRHGIQQLLKTESKVKAMIIISDGYPQDFDYGKDRTSKLYGIEDTARALIEAKREGIHTFCLTVDPAGHDYLKDMCPDNQYMIIQDIEELPRELSRVYSALTS